jgi:glyoxylase-like metal-dependent hydrolase (beta-lactamase superfamily II)
VFPTLRVAHTGDLFSAPGTPLIDTNAGGSGVAYPETIKKAVAGIKGVETVIPGHTAAPTTWAAFEEFGEFTSAFLAYVQLAVKDGKTLDEAIAGLAVPVKFKDYSMGRAKDNVTKIYNELKQPR